ncbi:hypothetical protein VTJ49DRAFT_739 [Mycothermus thermophilus]|uniref:Uncharacterized protein n=1 Tax=Humicola insolens TaxID=85995 RepID=A0ABR3VE69_HUMIN
MAFHDSCLAHLERFNDPSRTFDEEELNVLNAFARGMERDEPAVADAAALIDKLCPPLEPDHGEEAMSYFWRAWGLLVEIVMSSDQPLIPERIEAILIELRKIIGEKELASTTEIREHVWTDIVIAPLIDRFECCLVDPTYEPLEDPISPEAIRDYQNISWFAARLHAAEILQNYAECVSVFFRTLETDISTLSTEAAACRILVACGWLINCSKSLLLWAREYDPSKDVIVPPSEADKAEGRWQSDSNGPSYIPGGPLYKGPPTMCQERWAFWLARIDGFASDSGLADPVRDAASKAAKAMRTAEEEVDKEKDDTAESRTTSGDTAPGS